MHDKIMTLDIETYSSLDIGAVGAYRYAQSPDFRILLCSTAPEGNAAPITQDLTYDQGTQGLQLLRTTSLFDPHIIKRAHNAAFEWWCLSQYFGLSQAEREAWLAQWQDTMVHMLYCGLPASLDAAGKALGLPEDKAKQRVGRQLISIFCKPDKLGHRRTAADDPERWRLFCGYNAQDVVAERELERRTAAWPVPEAIWEEWRADVIANSRGIGADMQMVDGALRIAERPRTYICDAASWGSLPYDLASLGYYYTGDYKRALDMVNKALEYAPDDSRLLANRELIKLACS